MNARGNVLTVSDDGGSIMHLLRDDGQPASITVSGGRKTIFTYDAYGRRIKIDDPSAGVQTEEYVWNSDGSSKTIHTNPNGQVITYCDKYGRTTLVERPGEYNTTFIYDEYGRLSSEQSTNGTGIEYTYDEFDRVAMTREVVPDGKWLRKDYTYAPGGILASVKYTAQSGEITTETYTYANGYNTGINLPDGTAVWSLVSENDLGAATEVVTGNIDRVYGFTDFGLSTYRRMDDGYLQNFVYKFDPMTGNLMSRNDVINGQTEIFGYDNLNRLASMDERQISYDKNGNIKVMGGVGTMRYSKKLNPYRILSLIPEEDGLVPNRPQNISYTCYSRPSILKEGGRSAAFTYDGDGDRVKMYSANGASQVLTRYYIGARYEYDQMPGGTKERLYLGGDAYSAPMVYEREDNGGWNLYNIGRDYLGSITHIATADGNLVAEYSYDPWGRLRNPETLEIYAPGTEPELFLGRGYTGHEHLTWFGLINMNARLYDPLLGRFLSPDPYVQATDFTQSFNRYSYTLNNPLKYTDENGEFWQMIIACGIANWIMNRCEYSWRGLGSFAIGALSEFVGIGVGSWVSSAWQSVGFFGGAVSSAIGMGASSFVAATGNGWNSGKSFNESVGDGLRASLYGFLIGGVSGGISGGLLSLNNGGNFWTGRGAAHDCFAHGPNKVELGKNIKYSNKYSKNFYEKWFSKTRIRFNKLYSDGRVPNNNYIKKGDRVFLKSTGEETFGTCVPGIYGSNIYLYKAAFTSKEQLYLTMGHELLHAGFNAVKTSLDIDYIEYYQHAEIYEWSTIQADAWAFNTEYYQSKYETYSAYLYKNPFKYEDLGFQILSVNPF